MIFKNHGYNIRSIVRDEITKNDGVVMFTVPGHKVVGKGLIYYNVVYKYKNTIYSETMEFFIVNEGWKKDVEYYVWSKNVTNWFNGNFCTTMRLKK